MATVAQNVSQSSPPLAWFRELLKEELRPYRGRAALVARMVIAATLVMIITMTFRIPYGLVGGLFTFLISRESPRATVRAVTGIVLAFALATIYILIGAMFSLGDPILRLLWVIGTLFIMFYAISVITNYTAAIAFGILIIFTIPLWDMHIPAELKVEFTLWALLQMAIGSAVTLLVELVFAGLRPRDDLARSIAERLESVEDVLNCYATDCPVDERTKKNITRLVMVRTSMLRSMLRRSGYARHYGEQMGAVVALVGRLVDIAANLTYLRLQVPDNDRKRVRGLAESIARIRADLLSGRVPPPIAPPGENEASPAVPLLREMETTVSLIPQVFAGSQSLSAFIPSSVGDPPVRLFVLDALSNSDHLKFGLRGGLAASLCYIIYTSVAWPGINVAILICLVSALTTIGASRQKQVLSITGAIAGGVVIGMGAQVFILPYLDSISGFTLLFIAVTSVAAWLTTSSPRLSNFGYQLALAFYFINLQEFKMQTSLAVARDRVVGILFGLFMMWLVFDQLWGEPAVVEMKRAFISNLRLLAQFAREPLSKDQRVAIERSYSLRETINTNLDKVRTLADAVLFEFGPFRQQNLALRSRILQWQPQLRMIFVTRVTLLKYRLQLPGFELPEAVRLAQQEFDDRLAEVLEGMADRIEGKATERKEGCEDSFERLEREIRTCCSEESQEVLVAQLQTFLSLSRRIESMTICLDKEI
jgi:multidrug resistance protein MdtO